MKQTAVEWLLEQVPRIENIASFDIIEQAKEMEKEQIIEAYCMGDDNISAKQYYNETYKLEQ